MLVEINCESDFVARTEDFKELVHDIAMHIAASDPKYIRKEDVTPEAYEREKDIYRAQAIASGKPANIAEKMVEGKMSKFYEEVCLLEQPFIKDQTVSIAQLIATKIGKLGENIAVRRFARFKVGDAGETIAITKPEQKAEYLAWGQPPSAVQASAARQSVLLCNSEAIWEILRHPCGALLRGQPGAAVPTRFCSKRVCFVTHISAGMLDWIADDDSRLQTHLAQALRRGARRDSGFWRRPFSDPRNRR